MDKVLKENIGQIITKAQKQESCHPKLMETVLNDHFKIEELDKFIETYKYFCFFAFKSDFADNNPNISRSIEFLAKLTIKITLKCVEPVDIQDKDGKITKIYDISTVPFLVNLLDKILKCTNNEKTEIRYNVCYFIATLLENVGTNVEMDCDFCQFIIDSIIHLIDDIKPKVRLQALKALVRLQEPGNSNCSVFKSFLGLFYDQNAEIRKAVIKYIAPHQLSFEKIRERLMDVDVTVRHAAYTKWSDTNPKKYLKISHRKFILECGFNDENLRIKQLIKDKLLIKWLICFDGDYVAFLRGLKLDADEKDINEFLDLCEKVIHVFLKADKLLDIIDNLPIYDDKVIPIKELTLENVKCWSSIIKYLRKNDNDDVLNRILPELTHFSYYIESVIKDMFSSSKDEWENSNNQNIIYQLFDICSGYDTSDEMGRKTLYDLIKRTLITYKFQEKLTIQIIYVSSQLNHNIEQLISDICHVISDIREPLIEIIPTKDELFKKEVELTNIKIELYTLETEQEKSIENKDFERANIIKQKMIKLNEKLDILKNSKKTPTQTNDKKEKLIKDDPETIIHALNILIGLLKLNKIKLTPCLMSCKDEFLTPLLNNNLSEIHWRYILSLGLYCQISEKDANEHFFYFTLPIVTYRIIPNYDRSALKTSISCVTDLILIYRTKIFGTEMNSNSSQKSELNQTNRRKLYTQDMNESEIVDKNDITLDMLMEIIIEMFDDADESLQMVASESILRLIGNDFPLNQDLTTKLITKWFIGGGGGNVNTDKISKIQQRIGVIINYYANNVKDSKKVIIKSVLPVINNLINGYLVDVDIFNVIKFLSLITTVPKDEENLHCTLAVDIITKIMKKTEDTCVQYYIKLLTSLDVEFKEQIDLDNLIESTENLIQKLANKNFKRSLRLFVNKLGNKNLSTIRENETIETENNENRTSLENGTLNEKETPTEITEEVEKNEENIKETSFNNKRKTVETGSGSSSDENEETGIIKPNNVFIKCDYSPSKVQIIKPKENVLIHCQVILKEADRLKIDKNIKKKTKLTKNCIKTEDDTTKTPLKKRITVTPISKYKLKPNKLPKTDKNDKIKSPSYTTLNKIRNTKRKSINNTNISSNDEKNSNNVSVLKNLNKLNNTHNVNNIIDSGLRTRSGLRLKNKSPITPKTSIKLTKKSKRRLEFPSNKKDEDVGSEEASCSSNTSIESKKENLSLNNSFKDNKSSSLPKRRKIERTTIVLRSSTKRNLRSSK